MNEVSFAITRNSNQLSEGENESNYASLHVLDDTMENVNKWVKELPLGDTQESWVLHSPNVMLAQRCIRKRQ